MRLWRGTSRRKRHIFSAVLYPYGGVLWGRVTIMPPRSGPMGFWRAEPAGSRHLGPVAGKQETMSFPSAKADGNRFVDFARRRELMKTSLGSVFTLRAPALRALRPNCSLISQFVNPLWGFTPLRGDTNKKTGPKAGLFIGAPGGT